MQVEFAKTKQERQTKIAEHINLSKELVLPRHMWWESTDLLGQIILGPDRLLCCQLVLTTLIPGPLKHALHDAVDVAIAPEPANLLGYRMAWPELLVPSVVEVVVARCTRRGAVPSCERASGRELPGRRVGMERRCVGLAAWWRQ